MDRTTIFAHNTTVYNNKKSDSENKFTENFLCDEIHDNLRTLALFYPLGDDFNEIFEKGMFMKSNPKAFPHIAKYLFTICDANEFKKKFCWPIYNKAAEATFRNATLEFMNKLNIKYGLGLGELKNKIVVFPGGMEFMRVIYELTKLSMRLTLKRNSQYDASNQPPLTLAAANRKLHEIETLYGNITAYCNKIDTYAVAIKMKSKILRSLLDKVISNTNITPNHILLHKFTTSWNSVQSEIADKGIKSSLLRVQTFQCDCDKLEAKIGTLFKKQTITFDANALNKFTAEMQKVFPQHLDELRKVVVNGQINMNNLLLVFRLALPLALDSVISHKPRSMQVMTYESKVLQQLSAKTNDIFQKSIAFTTQLVDATSVSAIDKQKDVKIDPKLLAKNQVLANMRSLILSTPPISYDAIKRVENASVCPKRLSLLEDNGNFRNERILIRSTAAAGKPLNSILEVSNVANGSRLCGGFVSPLRNTAISAVKNKLDPLKMLQTISKKNIFRPTNTNQRIKTNEIQLRHGADHSSHKPNDTMLSVPEFSSTLIQSQNNLSDHCQNTSTDRIKNALKDSLNFHESSNNSDISHIYPQQHRQFNGLADRKGRSLMYHFAGAAAYDGMETINVTDIHRSPSGRIDPLIRRSPEPCSNDQFRSRKLFDKLTAKVENDSRQSQPNSTALALEAATEDLVTAKNLSKAVCSDVAFIHSKIESNKNARNINNKFMLGTLIDDNDESLLNISDSVLTAALDCSMRFTDTP